MNDFISHQHEKILACYGETPQSIIAKSQLENDLEKGGEGSKGGVITGHTSTGKPIYGSPTTDSYHGRMNKPLSTEERSTVGKIKEDMKSHSKEKESHGDQFSKVTEGIKVPKRTHEGGMVSHHAIHVHGSNLESTKKHIESHGYKKEGEREGYSAEYKHPETGHTIRVAGDTNDTTKIEGKTFKQGNKKD